MNNGGPLWRDQPRTGNALGNGFVLTVAFWAVVTGAGLLVGFGRMFLAAMAVGLIVLVAVGAVSRVRDRRDRQPAGDPEPENTGDDLGALLDVINDSGPHRNQGRW